MQFEPNLIERLLQYDDLAFAQFYEQTVDVFFRYLTSHYNLSEPEANDILSDVYIKIWENLDKYNKEYTFGQFTWTILKNHCKDYFKKIKPLFFSELEDIYGNSIIDTKSTNLYGHEDQSIESFFDTQISFEHIQNILSQCDIEDQEILHARYILQYPYEIIADMYGMKSDAIRQKISRLLKKLKKNLSFLTETTE